jgi:hypothetical protein
MRCPSWTPQQLPFIISIESPLYTAKRSHVDNMIITNGNNVHAYLEFCPIFGIDILIEFL